MMSIPHHHKTYWRSVRWIACRGGCRSPPKSAKRKRNQDTKRRQEATAHAGAQRPPPTGRPRVAFRGSIPQTGVGPQAEQPTARPWSQQCKREVLLDNRECKATVKARQGKAASPTPGALTDSPPTDRLLLLPAWCGRGKLGPAFAMRPEKERTETKNSESRLPYTLN